MHLILLSLALCAAMMLAVPRLSRRLSVAARRRLYGGMLAAYGLAYLYMTLLSRTPAQSPSLKWTMFSVYREWAKLDYDVLRLVKQSVTKSWAAGFHLRAVEPLEDAVLNVLLYLPLGYMLPTAFEKLRGRGMWRVLAVCACVSLLTEGAQYVTHLGCADLDDLLNNLIGAGLGMLMYSGQIRRRK